MIKRILVLLLSILWLVGVVGCSSQEPMRMHSVELPKEDVPQYTVPQKLQAGIDDVAFTNYDASFTWKTSDGTDCAVKVILPALNSIEGFAEEYNHTIKCYTDDLLDYIKSAAEAGAPSNTVSVSYDAYLNEDMLSILITEQFASGAASYQVASFDLEQRKELTTPELASRLLELDYPSFLQAGNAFVWWDFFNRYAETEPETTRTIEIFNGIQYAIPLDTYNLYNRRLFLNEKGDVMLLFQRVLLSEDWQYGLESEEYILPINTEELQWTASSTEDSMDALLTLPVSDRRYYPEYYSYLLQDALLNDPELFIKRLSCLEVNSTDRVIDYLYYAAWDKVLVEISEICSDLLSDESLLSDERHTVEKIYIRASKH